MEIIWERYLDKEKGNMDALIDYLAYLKVTFPLTIIIFVIFRFILAVKIGILPIFLCCYFLEPFT